jgi:hypothetical protein
VLTTVGVWILKTPVRAPRANAIAERWIASASRECLDQMLIVGERHLRLVLDECIDHYNSHRPNRAALDAQSVAGKRDGAGLSQVKTHRDGAGGGEHLIAHLRLMAVRVPRRA